VLQLFLHTNAMKRAGFPVRPTLHADPERLRRVRSLFLSLALGLALFQLNALLDSLIAYTLVPTGGVSALYYANRLTQLPIGVLGVALATAVFPELARRAKRGDSEGLGEILDRGVALGAFVALPAACGLAALAEPLVSALFERGAFSSESTQRTARVLLCLTPAVVTACVTPVITRAFYAEEEVKTPVRVGVVCVLVNLTLNLLLVGPLAEAGLALATSASQILNLVLQVAIYRRRRLARGERPATGRTLKSVVQSALLAGVMGVLAWATQRYLPGPELLRVLVAIGTGVAVYAGGAYALRLEPLRLLLARRG